MALRNIIAQVNVGALQMSKDKQYKQNLKLSINKYTKQGIVDVLVTTIVFFIIKYYFNFIKREREKDGALDALCPLSLFYF